ncbi:hypothetical protein [Glacieibacterium frigidum]|uniref:Histidine phosphotransferase ChpT C-terminal domain-containing protein n=1 Tax=Glacieibacterium frigidum TaxID=2593303 RepID=A0A552U8K4_9SPHN|nr:hypothetical protein [Glacieibacterium frigidum]TRW14550.1 hypothetical protein FMM06_12685 [Glacieibacterium frigidum]
MNGLAALLIRRLTHDFAGPVGAMTTVLELGPGDDPELLSLVADSATGLAATLKLYRFIATPEDGPVASATVRALLADWLTARGGPALDLSDTGEWPGPVARLTAALAMIATDVRAPTLTVTMGRVVLSAPLADELARVLGGEPAATPREALAGLAASEAAAAGLTIGVAADALTVYQGSALPL